jgi:hypothetical protein
MQPSRAFILRDAADAAPQDEGKLLNRGAVVAD